MQFARVRIAFALLCALFLIHPAPAQSPPSVLHVSSSDATCGGSSPCYVTIQDAVDAAVAGDTVRVQPGSYPELVRITGKSELTLESDPQSDPGSAVIEPADGGLAACLQGTAAVEVASSSEITLRRLAIVGYDGTGIRLRGGSQSNAEVRILGMQIVATGRPECGAAIQIEEPNTETLLAHNLIYANARDGIALAGGSPQTSAVPQYLWSNTIYGNGRHGVRFSGFTKPFLWNNLIAGNGAQPFPTPLLPAYGVTRDLSGLLFPLTGSQLVFDHNLLCGNRSGEIALVPTETAVASGNQTPTGSEGTGFAASTGCGDPAVLFDDLEGDDSTPGTLDDDFFPSESSPAVEAGADPPAAPALDLATLQADFEHEAVRPADGDGDELFHYDIGALEYGVAPTISVLDPEDESAASTSLIDVSGEFTGTAPLTIEVNEAPATLTGATFEGTATLVEGANTITVTATNAFGSEEHEITVTLPPRAVAITSPVDGSTAAASQINVSGTFAGALPVTVSVNGQLATLSGNAFSASVSLVQGANTVTATLSNEFGSASHSVNVTLPHLAVDITEPELNSIQHSPLLDVSGTYAGAA